MKVGNFGLAKFVEGDNVNDTSARHTKHVGTELYRSPEQQVLGKKINNCKTNIAIPLLKKTLQISVVLVRKI